MAEPITVTIGGEVITLPLIMNFAMLERVWPAIKAHTAAPDRVAQVSAAVGVIAGVLLETRPEITVPEIKKRLRVDVTGSVDEREILLRAVDQLCRASGLVKEDPGQGEAVPPENPADTTISTLNT